MGCVREGKVRLSVLKVHFCHDNTLCSIAFEPAVRFWCFNLGFEALNVYFKMELSFNYLVGPLFLESAEKRTELSKKCDLSLVLFLIRCKCLLVEARNEAFWIFGLIGSKWKHSGWDFDIDLKLDLEINWTQMF